MEIIERIEEWKERYSKWRAGQTTDDLKGYPFVENKRAPFLPARRALPMLNLALISSAGGYIDGTDPFDTEAPDGDLNFREIPAEVRAEDLKFAARGYDPSAVEMDINSQVPLARLFEFESNGIIGQLNPVWWSFSGFIPNAARLAEEMIPALLDRISRYEVQAALLIPASRLCHQSISLVARSIEDIRIPTMVIAVDKTLLHLSRPPRAAFYDGEFGSVSGQPLFKEHQRRILDEALRLIEPLISPTIRKLVVELESEVERARGER